MTRDDVWEWDVEDTFNPRYDARVSAEGVAYGCDVQGPFCGYDSHGKQTWEEFLTLGPPADIRMPALVLDTIRTIGLARRPPAGK